MLPATENVVLCPLLATACDGWSALRHMLTAHGHSLSIDDKTAPALSTPLTIVRALQITLGESAYRAFTSDVTIDIVGWSSPTDGNPVSNSLSQPATSAYLLEFVLRLLLPLVRSIELRGFGPEAQTTPRQSLSRDGWLSMKLRRGSYWPSEPQPTATILEHPGLSDGYFLRDGGCTSRDPGVMAAAPLRIYSVSDLQARAGQHTLPLTCSWRTTVDALLSDRRTVFVTSFHAHEHRLSVENLRSLGAQVVDLGINPFGSPIVLRTMDMLHGAGRGPRTGNATAAHLAPAHSAYEALLRYR